jgi:hypothetical protein
VYTFSTGHFACRISWTTIKKCISLAKHHEGWHDMKRYTVTCKNPRHTMQLHEMPWSYRDRKNPEKARLDRTGEDRNLPDSIWTLKEMTGQDRQGGKERTGQDRAAENRRGEDWKNS